MNLRNLIRQHITVVVVSCHSKSTISPSNELHCSCIGDQVLQVSPTSLQQAGLFEFFLVISIKDTLHGGPEPLLPFEHSLFCDDVGRDIAIQTALEEEVRQRFDIVVWVVVHHNNIVVVFQVSFVDNKGRTSVLRHVRRQESSFTNIFPTSAVFASNRMAFKKNRVFVTKVNPLNVNGITRNRNTVPSSTHGTIGAPKGSRQTHFRLLLCRWGNGGLLEDGSYAFSSFDGIMKHLVICFITALARKVIAFPS
mmetsp:Transcript_5647/g.11705  ORF Transcript_5647/g.11705 Transcript_5647/m.11705 type:complete len:252 (-) Transcript_5647:359-1114(-)